MQIYARERFEVNGKTVIFVPKDWMTPAQLSHLEAGELITFSARNEHDGKKHGRLLQRSLMIPKKVEYKKSGYNVWLELDINSLPTTRRAIESQF